ncbi:hypothetical protein AURDEDRAFT_174501 [Auricularia subglabra TFB-10046 SS5]|uniref:Nephrocystin 3-like N-terminal domain-containing protein n=1 Tax=Auricularia subglabra (strain TFB-10046 / SS5) TaxID=717982 RepID=J0LG62_AURST|nr:hypothetical protein AURDEDRAFT_174501 [Auricularia subglabra TFB-10046 SS5]
MATDPSQLELLVPILRPIPVIGSSLAAVVAVAVELRRIHLTRVANAEALTEIAERAALLSGSIAQSRQAAEAHAQALSPVVEELYNVVEKTKRRADELRTREEEPPSFWETLCPCFRLSDADKALKSLRNDMDDAFKRFSTDAQIDILSDLAQIRDIVAALQHAQHNGQWDTLRGALRPTDDALYNAHGTPAGCFEGTRQRLLSEIETHVARTEAQHAVVFISGLAGTGKSAIARSVCDRLSATPNVHLLSFFLSAESLARRDAMSVVHTLAFYLARAFPQLLAPLCDAIHKHDGALARPVQEQARILLEEIVAKLAPCSETLVVVIDGADVLDREAALLTALVAFARAAPMRVRIVSTGRPTRALRDFFTSLPSSDAPPPDVRVFRLEDVDMFEVKHDIRTYLRSSLTQAAARHRALSTTGRSLETDVETLATRASGIFLYAAAAVRCLERPGLGGPESCLDGLLHGGPAYSALSAILDIAYSDILRRAIPEPGPSLLKDQARCLLGSLIFIEPRLQTQDIAALLGYRPPEAQALLDLFSAVVSVVGDFPSIFHYTFSEFLQNSARCQDTHLVVDASLQHGILAQRCLDVVRSAIGNNRTALAQGRIATLAADLRRISDSGTHDTRLYAFRVWPRHLSLAGSVTPDLTRALNQFTERSLRTWIDVTLEFDTHSSVQASIRSAIKWCEVWLEFSVAQDNSNPSE